MKADIYFFCFIVVPNEAMCRVAVIIKGKIDDEHRIIVVIMNEEVVNARSPVFYIPEREFYRWSGTCAIRKAGCLSVSHQGGISGIDECIESVQFEEGFLSSYQINLAHANRRILFRKLQRKTYGGNLIPITLNIALLLEKTLM
ncbi:MAG: hypothetical protein IKH01_06190 [Prevotella sp.]|nr:hypothetical protein [Prevotella sp.]